ncbi:MAG: hypothetical protein ACRCYO_02325, partial [Bacteroidia bacterium]
MQTPDLATTRALQRIQTLIQRLNLDLSGLTVLTECASGAYTYTAVMAAMAGADVIAVGRDSSYGKFDDNKKRLEDLLRFAQTKTRVRICKKDELENNLSVDIVTNSGFLRPIDAALVAKLPASAVVCLMWETWEFRPGEIDLDACREKGIPVIGTNEHFPETDMFRYPGLLALHLLFAMQVETANSDLVLLGGGLTGKLIAKMFTEMGLSFWWFTPEGNERVEKCKPYSELRHILDLPNVDAVICAEHKDPRVVVGVDTSLQFSDLKNKFPLLRWGHLSGAIDAAALEASGLEYFPKKIMPFGYMTYSTDVLGPAPVLELNAAGLKVG